jgi:hypothetical protein
MTALMLPAPPAGRVLRAARCTSRDETFTALHQVYPALDDALAALR